MQVRTAALCSVPCAHRGGRGQPQAASWGSHHGSPGTCWLSTGRRTSTREASVQAERSPWKRNGRWGLRVASQEPGVCVPGPEGRVGARPASPQTPAPATCCRHHAIHPWPAQSLRPHGMWPLRSPCMKLRALGAPRPPGENPPGPHVEVHIPLGARTPGSRAQKPQAAFAELVHRPPQPRGLPSQRPSLETLSKMRVGACTPGPFQKFPANVVLLSLSLEEPRALTGW